MLKVHELQKIILLFCSFFFSSEKLIFLNGDILLNKRTYTYATSDTTCTVSDTYEWVIDRPIQLIQVDASIFRPYENFISGII